MRPALAKIFLAATMFTGCSSYDEGTTTASPSRHSVVPTTQQADSGAGILPQDPNGNLILFVSNQSLTTNPVDIVVRIDGQTAINAHFDVTGRRTPQHNWVKHQFLLLPGPHTVVVKSEKGATSLERTFTVKGKHWAVIDYWTTDPAAIGNSDRRKKGFSFMIQDRPIGFK